MAFEVPQFQRRSIRLKDYDYAQQGAYFVTICTHDRKSAFGDVVSGKIERNRFGEVVFETWHGLPAHYRNVILDAFVVMPNHVHGILILQESYAKVGAGFKPAPRSQTVAGAGLKPAPTRGHALSEIVRAFKTFSSRRINQMLGVSGNALWQRNYHEHVIRNTKELNAIRGYIEDNPLAWKTDRENPTARIGKTEEAWRV